MKKQEKFSGHRRQLTPFFAKEMIYDYAQGFLDKNRIESIEKVLKEEKDIKKEYEHISLSIEYCKQLSESKVGKDILEEVSRSEPLIQKIITVVKYDRLPVYLRWLVEGLVVSLVTASIAIAIPWLDIINYFPTLKRPLQNSTFKGSKDPVAQRDKYGRELEEIFRKDEGLLIYPIYHQYLDMTTRLLGNNSLNVITDSLDAKYTVQSLGFVADQQPSQVVKENTSKQKEISEKVVAKGEIYRATMELTNLEQLTPEIVAQIEQLDGKKAGRVNLGWRKPNGSYFHFSIPEANYEQLLSGLRAYGPVRIYKDPHWRKMPDGIIRVILMVEDADLKTE